MPRSHQASIADSERGKIGHQIDMSVIRVNSNWPGDFTSFSVAPSTLYYGMYLIGLAKEPQWWTHLLGVLESVSNVISNVFILISHQYFHEIIYIKKTSARKVAKSEFLSLKISIFTKTVQLSQSIISSVLLKTVARRVVLRKRENICTKSSAASWSGLTRLMDYC